MIPGIYHIRIEEKDKNEDDDLGTVIAAGPNDKSSSSANEPEKKILNPQWKNSNGETITKALVGDEVYLCAEASGISDGTLVEIKIVEKDDDGNDDDVTTLPSSVKDSKIRRKWTVVYTPDEDDENSQQEKVEKGYTLPEYAFTVECDGVVSEESEQLDVMGWIKRQIIYNDFKQIANKLRYQLIFPDGTVTESNVDENGFIVMNDIKYKYYKIKIMGQINGDE